MAMSWRWAYSWKNSARISCSCWCRLVEEEDEVVPEELKIVDEVREEAVKMLFVGARLEESHPLEERVYGG